MGAHHLWCPPRFVNRVENDVVDVIKGQEFRLRHLGEVGGQGAYRGSGCHVDLDRPTDDVHSIDEPQIGNWKTELWIDDLSQSCPRSRFTLISWSTDLSYSFTRALWIPLILLEVTVAMRVVGGILELWELRRWSAMLNALVLALFVVMVVVSVERGQVLRRRGAAAAA